MSIFQKLTKPTQSPAAPPHQYAYKTRFALLGTVGAGKSTVASLVMLTTQTLSADHPDFYCRVLEGTSSVYQDISNMREGHFPEKTSAHKAIAQEAGLLMEWERKLGGLKVGTKSLQIPLVDLAGEDVQMFDPKYASNIGRLGNVVHSAINNLKQYVRQCEGYVVVVKCSRAKGIFPEGQQLEPEDDQALSADPDVNLVRMIDHIVDYKRQHRQPIHGIAVVITAWDLLLPYAQDLGIDLFRTDQNDMKDFMDTFFPSVSQSIKGSRLQNVKYFPMYVDLEYEENGAVKRWKDGSPKIKRKESLGSRRQQVRDMRKPSYNEQGCVDLIEYLHGFAK